MIITKATPRSRYCHILYGRTSAKVNDDCEPEEELPLFAGRRKTRGRAVTAVIENQGRVC